MNQMKTEALGAIMEQPSDLQPLQEGDWQEVVANLKSAYDEAVNTRQEVEDRTAQIAEARDLYQRIVSSMSEAFFLTNLTGQIVLTNPAAARLLECEEEAILGNNLTALCGREDIPSTPWQLMRLSRCGLIDKLEFDLPTAKGGSVPVSFTCTLIRDKHRKITGVLAVAHDYRHTRRLIDDLVTARTRFEALLEFAPEAMVLADRDGKVTLVNSQTEKLFGYLREELIGQNIEVLFPERL